MPQPNIANAALNAALPYPTPVNSLKSRMCEAPKAGFRFVSMNVSFAVNPYWYFDLKAGAPNPPLEKLAAIYIDASLSFHDAFFFVPDSGYSIGIPAGGAIMIPIISGVDIPKFFILLAPDILSFVSQEPNQDSINIIVMNQYIPSFACISDVRNLNYNYGDGFVPTPEFNMDDVFNGTGAIAGGTGPNVSFTLIPYNKWYIKNLDINITGATSDDSTASFIATLLDGITPIGTKVFVLNGALQSVQLFKQDGLNYASAGGQNLKLVITNGAGIVNATVAFNVYGGVLIP